MPAAHRAPKVFFRIEQFSFGAKQLPHIVVGCWKIGFLDLSGADRGTVVQRYIGTEVQRYSGTVVQRYRGTEV